MTEQDWLTGDDPRLMLRLLDGRVIASEAPEAVETSDRKLRLFACACARRVWDSLADERSREAVDVAERYADGLATGHELRAASMAVQDVGDQDWATFPPVSLGGVRAVVDAFESCWSTPHRTSQLPSPFAQAALLRDIVGNPWRPWARSVINWERDEKRYYWQDGKPVSLGEWNTLLESGRLLKAEWLTPTVVGLAQAAYECLRHGGTLDPVRLAVLADALEEAGCDQGKCPSCGGTGVFTQEHPFGETWAVETLSCPYCEASGRIPHPLLAHLRSPRPHSRGCWALDLVLGKF